LNHGGANYKTKFCGNIDLSSFDDEIERNLERKKWVNNHDILNDKVEISVTALIEIHRAFKSLKRNKESYLYKVFSDDTVFKALNEIDSTYNKYFNQI